MAAAVDKQEAVKASKEAGDSTTEVTSEGSCKRGPEIYNVTISNQGTFDERSFEITRLEDWWKQAGACAS